MAFSYITKNIKKVVNAASKVVKKTTGAAKKVVSNTNKSAKNVSNTKKTTKQTVKKSSGKSTGVGSGVKSVVNYTSNMARTIMSDAKKAKSNLEKKIEAKREDNRLLNRLIKSYDASYKDGTLISMDKNTYGYEMELAKKYMEGNVNDREELNYKIYQKLRQNALPDFEELKNKLNSYYGQFSMLAKGYHKPEEYDDYISSGKDIKEQLELYWDYYSLYDDEGFKEFEKHYNNFDLTVSYAKEMKDNMSKFKDEDEYNGLVYTSEFKTYSDLTSRWKDLNKSYNTAKDENQKNDILKKMNWVNTYGINQSVLASMSDNDWVRERNRANEAYHLMLNEKANSGGEIEITSLDELPYQMSNLLVDRKEIDPEKLERINKYAANAKKYRDEFYPGGIDPDAALYYIKQSSYKYRSDYEDNSKPDKELLNKINANRNTGKISDFERKYWAVNAKEASDLTGGVVDLNVRGKKGLPAATTATDSQTYNFMEEDEVKTFNYLYNTQQDSKAAEQYLDALQKEKLNPKYLDYRAKKAYDFGKEHPWLTLAFNGLEAAGKGYANLWNNVENVVTGATGEIDPYSPDNISHYTHDARVQGSVDSFDSGFAKGAYKVGNTAVEQLGIALGSGGNGVLNGLLNASSTMQNTTINYKLKGASDGEAVGMGIINGLIEYGMEKLSWDKIVKTPDILTSAGTMKKLSAWGGKFARDFGIEGGTEVLTNWATSLAAFLTDNREHDEFLTTYDELRKSGLSGSDAFFGTVKEMAPGYLEEFVAGGFAGGVFGAVNTYGNVKIASDVRQDAGDYFASSDLGLEDVQRLLIMEGLTDEAEIANVANGIVEMGQGKKVSSNIETKIKENPVYRGILHGYVDVYDMAQGVKNPIDDSTDAGASSIAPKKGAETSATTLTADKDMAGRALKALSESSPDFATTKEGRAGRQVYLGEVTEGEGGLVDSLMKDGFSKEDALTVTNQMYDFMYEQGYKGKDMDVAINAVSENIMPGYEKTAELFYTAGKIDAQNVMRGKKSARVVHNDVLKEMYKEGEINHKTVRAINAFSAKTGFDIEFVEEIEGGHNASFNTKTGVLQISRNSKKPFVSAAIHETVHAIRSVDTGSYNQLKDVVYSVLSKNNEAYKGVWSEMYSLYKNEATDSDGNLNKDYISEELTAEVVSQLLTDEAFVNEMAKTDRNFAQRIYDIIVDFFDKMMLRYTDNEKVGSAQMDAAVKQLQSEFESIKKMYKKALANTEAKRGVNMTLPKNLEKQNSILYNKKWNTDLTRAQLKIVQGLLRKAGNPETTRITDTANWYKGRIGGQDLFVIYSTVYVNDPTILYEVKGVNAIRELDILTRALEVIESERSAIEKSRIVDELLSINNSMQKKHNMANNNAGFGGRGSYTGHAPVLQGKSSKFIGSSAFREVVRNLFEVQYGKTRDGEDVRLSKSSSDDNGNTEQFRVMWTLEENVLNRGEVSAFYDKVSEMKNQKWTNYKVSKDGEYIFEIENKLVYFDGDYDYPEITKVVEFNTSDGNLLEFGRKCIYDGEEIGYKLADAIEISETLLGQGNVYTSDFQNSRAFEREIRGRKRQVDTSINSQSGEDVKLSKSSVADPTENIEPPQEQTMSERSAASFELKAEVRRKLNEHIEKYGTLEKGVNPVRDVDLPKKTADDRYVRRGTRTVIESARVTDEVAQKLTEEIANGEFWTTYERSGDKKAQETAQQRLEHEGFEKLLSEWDSIVESDKKIDKQDMVNAQLLMEEAAKNGDTETVVKIVTDIASEATRAGQLVQSMMLLKKLGAGANVYKIEQTIKKLQKDLDKKFGKKSPTLEIPKDLMEEYAQVFESEDKAGDNDHSASDAIVDKIYEEIAKQIPAKWNDKLNTWRYFAMLGNPRTHIRNMAGNMVFMPAIFAKNLISATGEGTTAAVLKMFGRQMQRTKTVKGVIKATFKQGAYKYALDDATKIESILRGEEKYGDSNKIMQKVAVYKRAFMNKLVNKNSDLLEKEDWIFLRRHYARALTMYLEANKLDGDTITDKQLEKARLYAIREAQKATFRDASKLAATLSSISKQNKTLGFAVDAILPFKKTPINILKRGVEYSPVGMVGTIYKGIRDVRKGKFTASDFIDGLGANLTGTSLLALGVYLASKGILRGPGDDEEDSKFSALLGMQNYSLKIGDGTYTIDWLSPSAMSLFVGCEMWNAMDDGKLTFADIADALPKITEPLFDMSMLDGLANIVETASYSQSAPEALASILFSIPTSYAGQFVPTLAGQIARTIDPVRRKTYIDKNSKVPQWLQSFAQQQAKKIPFLTKKLQPYVNAKGEEELNAEGNVFARAMQNFLSPGYYKSIKSTAVDKEIMRLYESEGETAKNIIPKNMQKYITVDGERVNLSAEQYATYQKTAGQMYYSKLKEIISSDYYKELSDSDKVKLLEDVREYSVEYAKEKTLPEYHSSKSKLKTFMEVDGGYTYLVDQTSGTSKYEADYVGDKYQEYEKAKINTVKSIMSQFDIDNSDAEFSGRYRDKVYEYAKEVNLEKYSDGKYKTDKKWVQLAMSFGEKERAEFIYGETLAAQFDSIDDARETIYNDEKISGRIKMYVISTAAADKYYEYLDKYNVDPVAWLRAREAFDNTTTIEQNGEKITKKQQVVAMIDELNVSDVQKSAIYRALGYKDSKIGDITWDYSYGESSFETTSGGVTTSGSKYVKTYSVKNDGETKLSRDFSIREFACKDGSDSVLISSELVEILQKIRDHFGRSITINSGYRNAPYNRRVGGASDSQHTYGTAADIVVEGVAPEEVARYAEQLMPNSGGIGRYSTFTHVDVRSSKARWTNY